ncbi:uncharacterized protein K02A2.6-like [Ischnura elegans]|uniref:uncharacterized protein K02A2.6-like n=1 Tax=Ischnura elegans TaxID=197161 RepID=UPI001ED88C6C|nr:uncharacterized protein K02A2.6-like [Ischnura elegans]
MAKSKSLARSYVWWPKLDQDIEKMVKSCESCLSNKPTPNRVPLKSWDWPEKPWQRLHLDLAGPFVGKMFMVLIDSHTKWPEVKELRTSSGEEIISHLRNVFSVFGLPEQIVTDNGPQFTGGEFAKFCEMNCIRHIFSPPYHPATNGAAENMVKIFKNKLKTLLHSGVPLHVALPRFLFDYRLAPHSTTGEAPSKLMFGRLPRSRLAVVKPNTREVVTNHQRAQGGAQGGSFERVFRSGQEVMVKVYPYGIGKWVKGVVKEVLGTRNYKILTDDGNLIHRHTNQIQGRETRVTMRERPSCVQIEDVAVAPEIAPRSEEVGMSEEGSVQSVGGWESQNCVWGPRLPKVGGNVNDQSVTGNSVPQRRYPLRERKRRECLDL